MIRALMASAASGMLLIGATSQPRLEPAWRYARQASTGAMPTQRPTVSLSADGRWLAFSSRLALVPEDTNACTDVYVMNLTTGTTMLESATPRGLAADGESHTPDLSGDGRFLVFVATSGTLVAGALRPGIPRVFVRDRIDRATQLVSGDTFAGGDASRALVPSISDDGQTIVFEMIG